MLVAGACVFAVMPFTYLAVSGLGLLIVLRVIHGSATAIVGPVASASLSDVAPAHRRATWLSGRSALMRKQTVMLAAIVIGVTLAAAEARKMTFDDDEVGRPPKGFMFGHTRKVGLPGRWVVQQDSGGRFLAQIEADGTGQRYPLAVVSDLSAADVDVGVRFRPVSGRVDRAAGLVWRYQNEDNYYLVRANALENNIVLYKVENGRRTDLPVKGEGRTYGKSATVPSDRWSTLRVVATGPRFEVYFNGAKLYEVDDTTFTGTGRVGVWTKADSVTHFDDLTVTTK